MKRILATLLMTAVLVLSGCGDRPADSADTTITAVENEVDGEIIIDVDSEANVDSEADTDTDTNTNTDTDTDTDIDIDPDLGAAVVVLDLSVHAISDKNSIPTGGNDVATITALITDENNRAMAEQEIEFASTGGVLQNITALTNINGEASAILALAHDYRNQDITVTVALGTSSGSVLVSAEGSTIDIAGPAALVLGDTAELTATLTAGNGEPISNQKVIFTSSASNTLTPNSGTTDTDGRVVVNVDSSNGTDNISVTALEGSAVASHRLTVANDILNINTPAAGGELAVGTVVDVQVQWESNGAPMANQNLVFGITAGQIVGDSVVATDASGIANIQITSNSAGPATISISSQASGDPATQMDLEFIATTPASLLISASSTRVSTTDTSTITALVLDANGNPVKNQEVVFASADLKGGQLNPASAVSNSSGEASVTFTAGNQATIFEEIEIVARVQGTTIDGLTNLTVVERVLNVTIGTTDLIRELNGETQYSLPFVVQVADGGGAPLEEAIVEVSIRPLQYAKGYYRLVDAAGLFPEEVEAGNTFAADHWAARPETTVVCMAEDLNGNRILDAGEDNNNNGSLDPQDPAVVAADSVNQPTVEGGVIVTDATGSGFFAVIYPQSNAAWSRVEITARAKALGVEAEATFTSPLPVSTDEIKDTETSLPNHTSPYGTSLTGEGDAAIDCLNEF